MNDKEFVASVLWLAEQASEAHIISEMEKQFDTAARGEDTSRA